MGSKLVPVAHLCAKRPAQTSELLQAEMPENMSRRTEVLSA